jgi:hypothetical protein
VQRDNLLLIQPSRVHNNSRSLLINPAIVIVPVQRLDQRVISEASVIVVRQLLSISLTSYKVIQLAQPVGAAFAFAAADRVQRHDAVVQPHADEFVRRFRFLIAVLRRVVGNSFVVDGSWIRIDAADDFSDELRAEGRDSRHAPVSLWVRREGGQAGVFAEVVDAHSRQHGDDDVVVGEVCVEGAVEGEVLGVVGEGAVDAAVAGSDVLVGQAGAKFL